MKSSKSIIFLPEQMESVLFFVLYYENILIEHLKKSQYLNHREYLMSLLFKQFFQNYFHFMVRVETLSDYLISSIYIYYPFEII